MAFSPDGRTAAVAPSYGTVALIEVATGQELVRLEAPNQRRIGWLCFSPDGKRLAAAGLNHTIEVWDLSDVRGALVERGLDWENPGAAP